MKFFSLFFILLGISLSTQISLDDLAFQYKQNFFELQNSDLSITDLQSEFFDPLLNLLKIQSTQNDNSLLNFDYIKGSQFQNENSFSICFVSKIFGNEEISSDIGDIVYQQALYYKKLGFSVTFLVTNPIIQERIQFYKNQGIEILPLVSSYTKLFTHADVFEKSFKVYQTLKTQNFDFVHLVEADGLGYVSLLGKQAGINFNDTIFSTALLSNQKNIENSNSFEELMNLMMSQKTTELSDSIWTPNSKLPKYYKNLGWDLTKEISILPFLPYFSNKNEHENENEGNVIIKKNIDELIFFGPLSKNSGLENFCDFLDIVSEQGELEEIKVTFIGVNNEIDDSLADLYIYERGLIWSFQFEIFTKMANQEALDYISEESRLPIFYSESLIPSFELIQCIYSKISFLAVNSETNVQIFGKNSNILFKKDPEDLFKKTLDLFFQDKNQIEIPLNLNIDTFETIENKWNTYISNLISLKEKNLEKNELILNSENYLVSVIITTFNRPQLLKEAIDSIENQNYENIEIIIVDDSSENEDQILFLNSLEKLWENKDNRKIIKNEENFYLGSSRNIGAKNSNGKFITFLDDDNTGKINEISTFVNSQKISNFKILTAGNEAFTEDRYLFTWIPSTDSKVLGLMENTFGDANTIFIERDLFLEIGGFTEEKDVGGEDYEFLARTV